MSTKISLNIFLSLLLPILTAFLLQFLPLTNTAGFEFSFVMSLPLFLAGGYLSLDRGKIEPHKNSRVVSIVVLILPIIFSLISNLCFTACPVSESALFYLIISVPAFFFGYVFGVVISEFTSKINRTLLFIVLVILLLISLLEFYFYPQIYFFNLVFGFFPGTIYDENISLSFSLILYRLLNIFFFAAVYYYFTKYREKNSRNLLGFATGIIIWFAILKSVFGFVTTESSIEYELSKHLDSEHFEIFADPGISYNDSTLIKLHEFYYYNIFNRLELSEDVKIKSYIFKNKSQKKELFGSENADVAKPWLKQIYLDESSFENTLEHELVHILAGEFGNPPFQVARHINPALIEGIAVAVENNYGYYNIDYPVQLAINNSYDISISELFSGLDFFGNLSSVSYLFAGSFFKYLMQNYEIEKIKELYQTGNFEDIFNQSLQKTEKDFRNYLIGLNYPSNTSAARLYFGRKPLIKKVCPRYSARILAEADNLYRAGEFSESLDLYNKVFQNNESYSAFAGIISSHIRLNNYSKAFELIQDNFKFYENTSYFYNLELRAADTAILNSDSSYAETILDSVIFQNPSLGYSTASKLRKLLLEKDMNTYKDYLLENSQNKYLLLKSLFDESNSSVYIPSLIEYSLNLKIGEEVLLQHRFNYDNITRIDIYAALKLSKFAFRIGDLNSALKFAQFAVENNKQLELQTTLDEQHELINWTIEKLN